MEIPSHDWIHVIGGSCTSWCWGESSCCSTIERERSPDPGSVMTITSWVLLCNNNVQAMIQYNILWKMSIALPVCFVCILHTGDNTGANQGAFVEDSEAELQPDTWHVPHKLTTSYSGLHDGGFLGFTRRFVYTVLICSVSLGYLKSLINNALILW